MDADPPNIRGRPEQARKQPTDALVLIHRGIEDGMSRRYFGQRGRPVPGTGSRLATIFLTLAWAGIGEDNSTCEVPETGWREGSLLLAFF